jgi:DNA-binding response OmpR family regulator
MMTPDMRVLVVEDDKKIALFVVNGLKQSGYAVDHCADGEAALAMAGATNYDAAVVDLMLPRLDGLSVIQRLRSQGVRVPILVLSAKASVDDRVKGLQAGGDDYLTKPFAFSELLARIQALIRRASQPTEPTRLTVGDLTLDLLTRQVTRGTDGDQDNGAGARVGLQLRSADQRGGRAGAPVAGESGPGQEPAAYDPRSGVCSSTWLSGCAAISACG